MFLVSESGEISLKSDAVRRKFEGKLIENIRRAIPGAVVRKLGGKLEIEADNSSMEKLRRIFGIAWIARAERLNSSDMRDIEEFFTKRYESWIPEGKSFAVRVRRVGNHPYTSVDLAKMLGSIARRKVDLKNPDVEVFVEVRGDKSYFYVERERGPGGLPLGTAGNLVALISGGIDSPVAAWMMMRRGASITALYAMSPLAPEGFERFVKVIRVLREWHIGEELRAYAYTANYEIPADVAKYAYVLERRIMLRVANELAKRVGAKGIVTGDSLGQVSSQTLDNLMAIDAASELPVYRPLISMDKDQISNIAREIGTFSISTERTAQECGSLTICVKKPVTKARLDKVLEIERRIDAEEIAKRSIETLQDVTSII
jgi:thiamine biosynthesis protein ThiI